MFSRCNRKSNADTPWAYARDWVVEKGNVRESIMTNVWSPIIWKGGHRDENNFISADYCVLDFDEDLTLKEAEHNIFCDVSHIIATTKNHQKSKDGVVADRFRVIIPFSKRITDLAVYRATMHHMVDVYSSDIKCKDGARFFFPCQELISYECIAEDGTIEPVIPKIPTASRKAYNHFGNTLPSWILEALQEQDRGVFHSKRNDTIFRVSAGLASCGIANEQLILSYINKSKIPLEPVNSQAGNNQKLYNEVIHAIRRGIKRGIQEFRENI